MHLTVEQALSIYPLSEGKLIAGSGGKNRVVKSINVMDAPDISDWIKEGEMLFTTAYLIKDHPEDAAQLLHKLNGRGSSGLGIKLGRFWDSIPVSLAAEADELDFPLIELPYQFTFSDQMNGLFRAEMQRNTRALHAVLEKQKRLIRFALQSNHMEQLFDAFTDVIGYPIAVIGARGQLVYNNSGYPGPEVLRGWPWQPRNQRMRGGDWQAFRVPLLNRDKNAGFVLFFTTEPFDLGIEQNLFVQAAELISFHMNFNYQDYFERSLHKDFGMLIKRCLNNGLSIEGLIDYADKLDIGLFHGAFQCVLTDIAGPPDDAGARQGRLLRLKEEYLGHPAIHELRGIHVVMDEGLLSVYPADQAGIEKLPELLSACFNSLGFQGESFPKAAVSGRKTRAEHLREAFSESKETLRMALRWGLREHVVHYQYLDLSFLFEQVSKERMEKYCNNMLNGLLSKEPDYVQEMLRTLEVYLENDGHVNETAKKLFIHRNTATYRIEKLSEMLEVDLKKINDLLRLKLVFLFRRMLEREC
ncbi:PucR family transcriptional regulator [Paenibacillus alkalitolerans]|uniref:PucR family transcriptional regulator n=1 Tax=Paenibacillus alkalitolerans TaxID=2799335 RepID=UPI0018F3DF2E|nr:PucR family transcriptional regulator [Paenibacillus alkalitolerans]